MFAKPLKALALSLCLALCVPAAASADSSATFALGIANGAGFTSAGPQTRSTPGAVSTYSQNGSAAFGSGGLVGDAFGTNYLTTFRFTPAALVNSDPYQGTYASPFTSASLTLLSTAVTGTPTFNVLLYTGSSTALASSQSAYQAILANSVQLGSFSLSQTGVSTPSLSSAFLSALNNASIANFSGTTHSFTIAVTGGAGVGAPGPVAGAGLPFLIAAGALYAARRRASRAARAA